VLFNFDITGSAALLLCRISFPSFAFRFLRTPDSEGTDAAAAAPAAPEDEEEEVAGTDDALNVATMSSPFIFTSLAPCHSARYGVLHSDGALERRSGVSARNERRDPARESVKKWEIVCAPTFPPLAHLVIFSSSSTVRDY
jgi:hypothetical protein